MEVQKYNFLIGGNRRSIGPMNRRSLRRTQKYDRFLLDIHKVEWKKCFDTEWVGKVAEKEGKKVSKVWEEIENKIKGVTYDLRLGEEAFTSRSKELINLKEREYLEIKSGETVLLITYEKLNLPRDYMALLSLKTSHARKGLINISGFHVDPNYKGKLVFSLYNSSPRSVVLKYKDPIYHMFVVQLSDNAKETRPNFYDMDSLRADWVEAIRGEPTSLQGLHSDLEKLRTRVNVLITVFVGILVTLVGYLLALLVAK